MPHARPRLGARFAAFLSVALAFTGLQLVLAPAAQAASGTVVISEIFGANSATNLYNTDFVELHNPTGDSVSLAGMSVQYRSAASASGASSKVDLSGSIPAGGYVLVGGATTAGGTGIPTPDFSNTGMNMSGTNGVVILANSQTLLTNTDLGGPSIVGTPGSNALIQDLVGFGTANIYETAAAPAPSTTTVIKRTSTDADNNSLEFSTSATGDPTNLAGSGPSPLSLTNPGTQNTTEGTPVTLNLSASGGTPPYTWSATDLPSGLSIDTGTGQITGTPDTVAAYSPEVTVTDDADPTPASDVETFTWNVTAVGATTPIADIQGTGARSPFAPESGTGQGVDTLVTEGVITAVYEGGFNNNGDPTCGFCGFVIQTEGTGGPVDATPGASDAIFVWGGSGFTGQDSLGADLAVGDSVRVTGKAAEFGPTSGTDLNSLTQLVIAGAGAVVSIADLAPVVPQTVLPTSYADREAHESELFAPTDVVVTDTFNFETFGELGLATGDEPLTQPTELCADDDTTCIATAQADLKNRGYFLEDGTNTTFLSSSNYYRPHLSNNSDIPLPFMDQTHTARIGAQVTWPQGGILDFRNRKWYVNPPRAVLSTHDGAPDLGLDVVTFEDTRPANVSPADVGGDLKIATYNVENYFTTTGEAFAAANPFYDCGSDFDRDGNPVSVYQCESPAAIPTAWDPVTGVPTAYAEGLVTGPRGAWRQVDLDRQTDKIVTAINGLGADVVSLQELANPNKLRMGVTNGPLDPDLAKADSGFGTPIPWRDEAIAYLVDALNDDAGAGTWGFVASPEESTDATPVPQMCATTRPNGTPVPGPAATVGTCSWASGQDVIRNGFIYKRATVVPVGPSDLDLPNSSAPVPSPFDNAREPLAQFFKPVGHPNSDGFVVINTHFKSKGDTDSGAGGPATGDNENSPLVGAFNGDRTRQAQELLRFANEFAAKWDTDKVFLLGDFNAYSNEDPVRAILDSPDNTLGFGLLESDDANDTTYVFSHNFEGVGYGARGSLDHVFASDAAEAAVTGVDVWEINANESSAFNFGRFNTNKTDFFDPATPFAGSDHNPALIGLDVAGTPSVRDIQVIGSNDFHGRLLGSTSDGGAAQLAGAVKSLKATYDNGDADDDSVFVAAGDLIGASTFESFVQQDKPTLDALNEAGLEVSAVGNHEFDQGVDDLLNRVMQPYHDDDNPYGADGGLDFEYIGANVVWETDPDAGGPIEAGDPIVLPTFTKDFGDGITFGFVGAVTEDLMSLVNPAGMDGVEVTPIAAAVNDYATQLKGAGADIVVLLVHEGAPSTSCATMDDPGSAFGDLLGDLNADIDAVISGHTHLAYSCAFPVAEWAGDPITERPVVSAGQYGVALDQIVWSFDTTTGEPVDVVSNTVGVKGPGSTLFSYPEDPAVKAIVDAAVVAAEVPGAVVLGQIGGAFKRARLADTVTENRGGESTLGNLVAEIQRWATPETADIEPAQIAFMNPGGLRDDMNGTGAIFPKDVTYRAAAGVQPFANTLVNIDMTGAQIEEVLEQQWQRDAQGNIPSRAFLRLGTSKGFTYTYTESEDPAHPGAMLGEVTSMWLDGVQIEDATTYSVTVNSFLAAGGDNFWAFADGADKRDTGVTDLQAQVDYMAANADPTPLVVDYGQHAVRVTFPGGAPASYGPGDTVEFDLASLAMTAVDDEQDATIEVVLDGEELGSFPVDNAASNQPNDEAGKASVSVVLPADVSAGTAELHLVGATTGTDVIVPIAVDPIAATTNADDTSVTVGQDVVVPVTVTSSEGTPEGTVEIYEGAALLGSGTLSAGVANVLVSSSTLAVGTHDLTARYLGSGVYQADDDEFVLTVTQAAATLAVSAPDAVYGQASTVTVSVGASGVTPTGTVQVKNGATVLGTGVVANGVASVTLPARSVPPGTTGLTAVYSGDMNLQEKTIGFTQTVAKATPTVKFKVKPNKVKADKTKAKVTVKVTADGVVPVDGKVKITVKGQGSKKVTLKKGKAKVKLGVFGSPGKYQVKVKFLGTDFVNKATKKGSMTVIS